MRMSSPEKAPALRKIAEGLINTSGFCHAGNETGKVRKSSLSWSGPGPISTPVSFPATQSTPP